MNQSLFLFFYSTLKAFLPLPSLEVVLLPLVLIDPSKVVWYSFVGAIGTFLGGTIGYFLASSTKESLWMRIVGEKTWNNGKQLMHRYGVLAIIIGGITPIPDFILAYLAGFLRMNYFIFALSDGLARLVRSFIVLYLFTALNIVIDMDRYGMYILYAMMFYFLMKYVLNMLRSKVK